MAIKKATGTKTTETIIGSAATKLSSAVGSIKSALESIDSLESKITDYTLKVTDFESKIDNLQQDYINKVAQTKIELDQAYQANKVNLVNSYLTETSSVIIPQNELQQMRNNLTTLVETKEQEIKAEVGKAVGIAKASAASELRINQLEFEKKEAGNVAQIQHLQNQNTFLAEQVALWKGQLEKQVAAETERSKNSAVGTINLGSTDNKR